MSQIIINTGNIANDGTGDPLRTAFNDTNNNFTQIFNAGPVNSNITIANNTIQVTNTNGNLKLATNGIGVIVPATNIVPDIPNVRYLGTATNRFNTVYAQYLDAPSGSYSGNLYVGGNLFVVGNTITTNYSNIGIANLNITLATDSPNAVLSNNAGIIVHSANAKILYNHSANTWNSTISVTAPAFIGDGSQLTNVNAIVNAVNLVGNVLSQQVNESNLTSFGSVTDISATGNISTTGNVYANIIIGSQVSANFLTGDGSNLINITASTIVGNVPFAQNASSAYTANLAALATQAINADTALFAINANLAAFANVATSAQTANSSRYAIQADNANSAVVAGMAYELSPNANISVSGNITTSGYFIGNGSQLTGIVAVSDYGNANVAAYLPTYTGNIGANVVTANYLAGDGSNITSIPAAGNTGYVQINSQGLLSTYGGTPYDTYSTLSFDGSGLVNINGTSAFALDNNTPYITVNTPKVQSEDYGIIAGPAIQIVGYDDNYNTPRSAFLSLIDRTEATQQWDFGILGYGSNNFTITNVTGNSTWTFDTTGNLSIPGALNHYVVDNLANLAINSWTPIQLTTGDGVNTGYQNWTFDNAGLLTLPGGGTITSALGRPEEGLWLGYNGHRLLLNSDGQFWTGGIELGGNALPGYVGSYGNITLNANIGTGPLEKQWVFGTDGNLTLPSNIASINYANGDPYVSNYGNSNVAAYLPTYTGDLSANNISIIGNIVTAGPQGNITGANVISGITLSASGSVYANNISVLGNINGRLSNGNSKISIVQDGNITLGIGPFSTPHLIVDQYGISVFGNVVGNYFYGDGSNITDLPSSNLIVNGNSYANIPTTGGNLNINIPAVTVSGIVFQGSGYTNGAYTDQPTTGGTGTGLTLDYTINLTEVVSASVNNPGTGYLDGDVVTITGGSSNATILISVVNNEWAFNNNGNLTFPQGGYIGPADVKGQGTMLSGGLGNLTSVTSYYADAPGIYSSCLTANPDGTLNITTYGNGTGQLGQWNFANSTLSAPGNIIASTFVLSNAGNGVISTLQQNQNPPFGTEAFGIEMLTTLGSNPNVFSSISAGPDYVALQSTNAGNANITAQGGYGVTITTSDSGGNNIQTWTFEEGGQTQFPGTITAVGNISGAYILGDGGLLSNIAIGGNTAVSTTGNVSGGNIRSAGTISASGNIIAPNFIGNLANGASRISVANNGNTTVGVGPFSTTVLNVNSSTGISVLGNIVASNYVSATGNVYGGNVLTGGGVSATGNIAGGNISATNHTGTTVSVTGNITAGNIINTGISSVTGNITAGNVLTAGQVSATGNITTANYFVGNGSGLTNVAQQTTGSWTVTAGTNTYSFTVSSGTYNMWVTGNIHNGIIVWNALATITNTNVPVVGTQYAWVYNGGGTPLDFVSIPTQFTGTSNAIVRSNVAPSSTTNRFDFSINNTSGNSVVVNWGYTKL
jgi:filamentous hemagglutinin